MIFNRNTGIKTYAVGVSETKKYSIFLIEVDADALI
jgi:hypothetical protein